MDGWVSERVSGSVTHALTHPLTHSLTRSLTHRSIEDLNDLARLVHRLEVKIHSKTRPIRPSAHKPTEKSTDIFQRLQNLNDHLKVMQTIFSKPILAGKILLDPNRELSRQKLMAIVTRVEALNRLLNEANDGVVGDDGGGDAKSE